MLATALKAKRFAPLRLGDANRKTQHKYLYGPVSCEQNRIPPTASVMWNPAPARAKRRILRPPGIRAGGCRGPHGGGPWGICLQTVNTAGRQGLRRFYGVFTDFDARLVGGWRIFRNCSPAIFVAMLERLVGGPIAKKGVGEYAVPVVHALRRRGSSYGTP